MLIGSSISREFQFFNNCNYTLWIGNAGNFGQASLENGGFILDAYERVSDFKYFSNALFFAIFPTNLYLWYFLVFYTFRRFLGWKILGPYWMQRNYRIL